MARSRVSAILVVALALLLSCASRVWANDTAQFAPAIDSDAGYTPMALVFGDFDHDGHIDVAVVNQYAFAVSILLGNGDGTFRPGVVLATGALPAGIAVGDFNGDGELDLAVANIWSSDVSIFLGIGNGDFASAVSVSAGDAPNAVVAADINHDGIIDLIVANGSSGDLVGENVSVLLGVGDGTFAAPVAYGVGPNPRAMVVGDFNGDGHRDIAVAIADADALAILLGNGDGTFRYAGAHPVGYFPRAIAIADFNGDGKPDLAVAHGTNNDIAVLRGRGDGTFDAASRFVTGMAPAAVAVADFDGDGIVDIAVANFLEDNVTVLHGVGNGRFLPAVPFTVGSLPGGLGAIDVNGDGMPDLVTANYAGNTVSVLLGTRDTTTPPVPPPQPPVPVAAPRFISAPPPDGNLNEFYDFVVAADGTPQPTLTVSTGALPPGLTLSAQRHISGTPTAAGHFEGVLTASNGIAPAAEQPFAITIAARLQTITFEPLPDALFGTPPFNLAATASSGLPVAFVSLTLSVCDVAATTLAFKSTGVCRVRASQQGNASIGAALPIERSFSVSRGLQTVSFAGPATLRLGVPPIALDAVATSGLPVSFLSGSPSVCAVANGRVSALTIGACVLRAGQAGDALYLPAAYVERAIPVLPAYQSINFAQPSAMSVNAAPRPLSASATSGLPVTILSLTPAVCSASGSTLSAVAAGTCGLRATQAGDTTYAAAQAVERTFPVVPGAVLSAVGKGSGPFVAYATYLGGYGADYLFDVMTTPDGHPIVAASVASSDFPGLSSSEYANAGLDLLVVAAFRADAGRLERAAAIGGRSRQITGSGGLAYVGPDQVEAAAVDRQGNVYVAAYSNAVDYPRIGGAYWRTGEKFIYRVDAGGSVETASAPIDPAVQTIRALAVDDSGAMFLTGVAAPGLATTSNAFIAAARATSGGAYLIKLAPGGLRTIYSTYLSLPGSRASVPADSRQSTVDAKTTAYAIAIDSAGNAHIAGQAAANDFPATPGAPDTRDSQHRDAFVAKVDPTGSSLVYVARLGGTDAERATSIALAPDGDVVIGGKTATQPFVGTSGAFQSVVEFQQQTPLVDRETGFVARLSSDGRQWRFIAAVGAVGGNLVVGSGFPDPSPMKVAIDRAGAIYAVGTTFVDRSLPTLNNMAGMPATGAFVQKISADGRSLDYATGLGAGIATGVAVDGFGNAFIAGYQAAGLATVNASLAAPAYDSQFPAPFLVKLNEHSSPLLLTSLRNPSFAGESVEVTAKVADPRFSGAVDFHSDGQFIASVQLVNGSATLPLSLSIGPHRLQAILRDNGPFAGHTSDEVLQVVNQSLAAN